MSCIDAHTRIVRTNTLGQHNIPFFSRDKPILTINSLLKAHSMTESEQLWLQITSNTANKIANMPHFASLITKM